MRCILSCFCCSVPDLCKFTGIMKRAEELVSKMESGIRMKSKWASFSHDSKSGPAFALPNEEV